MTRTLSESFFNLNKSMRFIARSIVITLLCFGPAQSVVYAGASLMITPTRIVFDDRMRTAQVTLMNNGNEAGNYRISLINQKMTDDGKFEAIEDGTEGMYSNNMVRYSPRQITLPAGQSQVIRLMLRKPRDLKDGEYRSHMLIQSLPKANKSSLESASNTEPKNISVEILPIVGISIPVIVRHGNLSSEITLSDVKYTPADETHSKARVSLDMHRTGNSSVYGDFRVIHIQENGLSTVVGLSNGVAVYTPNTVRHYEIPLTTSPDSILDSGKLRIVFLESGKNEENGLITEINHTLQ